MRIEWHWVDDDLLVPVRFEIKVLYLMILAHGENSLSYSLIPVREVYIWNDDRLDGRLSKAKVSCQ